MSFLNAILLGGAAAFAIPLIIHILNKRRFRTVHWGAMHLIAPILKKNNQRIRVEQLLLLLLRIAIPVLLALCLARPVLTGVKRLDGDEKTSTVFVLDNSFSMQDGTAARSNFTRAREEITKTIGDMRKGSDAAVVLMGGNPEPLLAEPTHALEDVAAGLRETRGSAGPAAVAESIQGGVSEFDKMSHGAREVIFVSDFQAADWRDAAAAARRNAMDQVFGMDVPPTITLFRVADGGGENVSVTSVEVSSLVLGAGQKFSLRANLENHGETTYPDLMVFFKVDGVEKRSAQITLAPGQGSQVLFTHTFETAGSHHVEISTDADALKADNVFTAAFSVWDEVPVLLVDGAPSDEPLEGETDFLQIALRPFDAARATLSDLVTSEVVRPDELDERRLGGKRVVVLANVRRLHAHQLSQLEKFVADGGGLVVFPGDEVDPKWYNEQFFKGGKGLLPQQYVDLAGTGSVTGGGGKAKLVATAFKHPALAFFNDPRNGQLSAAEFATWFHMGVGDDQRDKIPASLERDLVTLARLDGGDPFLVERPFGEGRVLQAAAPADADWGNLPTQPVYLPLMQRLVTYLAASVDPPRNLVAGNKLVALLPAELAGKRAVVENPAGVRREVEVRKEGSRAMIEFADTAKPGLYTVVAPDAESTVYHFAVNLDRGESELATLNDQEVRELAEEMDAALVTSFEEYKALDRQRRFGTELWKPLLIALIAFLFLELLYQQWVGRTRTASDQ